MSIRELIAGGTRRPAPFALRRPRIPGDRSQRALFGEGVLTSGSDAVLQFLPVYLVFLGASAAQIGLLSAAGGLAGLIALGFGAWVVERVRSRKLVMLLGQGVLGRLLLLAFAGVPLLLDGRHAILALIALAGARVLVTTASHPAWTSLFGDVVPEGVRRRFTSARSFSTAVIAMVAAPSIGWLIHSRGGVEGFQWAFLVAAAIGFASTVVFARVHDAGPVRPAEDEPPRPMLGDARFRRFLVATLLLHGSAMIAGPFFLVHLVKNLGATPAHVGALASVDPAAAVVGQAVAAFLVIRFAPRRLFGVMLLVSPVVPLAWLFIQSPWQAVLPNVLGGATWAVIHLVSFNLLLQYAPRDALPRYAATLQAMTMCAAFVAPLAGSALVGLVGMQAVFVISALGRLAAFAVFTMPAPVWAGAPWRRRTRPEVARA